MIRFLEDCKNRVRYEVSTRLATRQARLEPKVPLISFTFDDIPVSAFDSGLTILENWGCRATCYIAAGLCADRQDCVDERRIRQIIQRQHEIGCHTYSHLRTGRVTRNVLLDDLDRNRAYFAERFEGYSLANFSYPFGSIGVWNKSALAERFSSLRGTCPGVNAGLVDLNTLRANRLYSCKIDEKAVDRLISNTIEDNGWLIFYTHDVSDRPSPHGCTVSLLEHAVRRAVEAEACVTTVADALLRSTSSASSGEQAQRVES